MNKKKYKVTSDPNVPSNKINLTYPSASIMLEIAKDEYTKERERTDSLDNKASIFISAIIAISTIYIPIIPFSAIKKVYNNVNLQAILISISMFILGVAFISLVIAFYNLYKSFSVKPFPHVDFEKFNDETVLLQDEKIVERGLLQHYHTILIEYKKLNNDKAIRLARGLKFGILFFALMSLSTISIIILIS